MNLLKKFLKNLLPYGIVRSWAGKMYGIKFGRYGMFFELLPYVVVAHLRRR